MLENWLRHRIRYLRGHIELYQITARPVVVRASPFAFDLDSVLGRPVAEAEILKVAQRQVLYLGEINDSQQAAWCKTLEDSMRQSIGLLR